MKRRDFLRTGFFGTPLGLQLLLLNSGCVSASERSIQRTPSSVRVRRDLNDPMGLSDLKTYAKAVSIMRSLPRSDGRNWKTQAEIHLNLCRHGSWLFLPWHRDYILRFENIIREIADAPNFCLPYWDWTKYPGLPKPFTSFSDPDFGSLVSSINPLEADPSRGNDISSQIAAVTNTEVMKRIMAIKDFNTFLGGPSEHGAVEPGPHNGAHIFVGMYGGPMMTMASPLDPIFWVHHCNVDRIWAAWQKKFPEWADVNEIEKISGNGNGAEWLSARLDGFYDIDGAPTKHAKTPRDLLNPASLGSDSYSYDTLAIFGDEGAKEANRWYGFGYREPASDGRVNAHTVAATKDSIVATPKIENNRAAVAFDVKRIADQQVAGLVEHFFKSTDTKYCYRLNVAGLPNVRTPTTGPILRIDAIIPTANRPHEFIANHCSIAQGAAGHQHGVAEVNNSMNLDFGWILKRLRDVDGFKNFPAGVQLLFSYFDAQSGHPMLIDRFDFSNVFMKLMVIG